MHFEKAALRAELRAALRGQPRDARAEAGRELERLLLGHPLFVDARRLLAFWPMPDELPLGPLLACEAGRRPVLLPRVEGMNEPFGFVRWTPGTALTRDRSGMNAPEGAVEPPQPGDLLLVPALGFAPDGSRLGRGRGLYDRTLAALPRGAWSLGVGQSLQLRPALPTEPHDVLLTALCLARSP